MRWSVASACCTASAEIALDSCTRRVISEIDWDSSSEADAAERTWSEASSDAPADFAGQVGGGPRGIGQLPGDTLELAGGIQHLVEDAADAGAELIDEIAQFGLALLGRRSRSFRLLAAHARALQRVVLEHGDGAGDLADLVGPVLAIDRDVALAVGECRQRARDRGRAAG